MPGNVGPYGFVENAVHNYKSGEYKKMHQKRWYEAGRDLTAGIMGCNMVLTGSFRQHQQKKKLLQLFSTPCFYEITNENIQILAYTYCINMFVGWYARACNSVIYSYIVYSRVEYMTSILLH